MLELVNETGAGAVVVPGWDLAGNYRAVLVARLTSLWRRSSLRHCWRIAITASPWKPV